MKNLIIIAFFLLSCSLYSQLEFSTKYLDFGDVIAGGTRYKWLSLINNSNKLIIVNQFRPIQSFNSDTLCSANGFTLYGGTMRGFPPMKLYPVDTISVSAFFISNKIIKEFISCETSTLMEIQWYYIDEPFSTKYDTIIFRANAVNKKEYFTSGQFYYDMRACPNGLKNGNSAGLCVVLINNSDDTLIIDSVEYLKNSPSIEWYSNMISTNWDDYVEKDLNKSYELPPGYFNFTGFSFHFDNYELMRAVVKYHCRIKSSNKDTLLIDSTSFRIKQLPEGKMYVDHYLNSQKGEIIKSRDVYINACSENSVRLDSVNFLGKWIDGELKFKSDEFSIPFDLNPELAYIGFIEFSPYQTGRIDGFVRFYFTNKAGEQIVRINDFITEASGIVSVEFTNSNNSLYLYPNPATDYLNIDTRNSEFQIKNVAIYDILGRSVYSTDIISELQTIPVNSLGNGIYNIIIESTKGYHTSKFIIER